MNGDLFFRLVLARHGKIRLHVLTGVRAEVHVFEQGGGENILHRSVAQWGTAKY